MSETAQTVRVAMLGSGIFAKVSLPGIYLTFCLQADRTLFAGR